MASSSFGRLFAASMLPVAKAGFFDDYEPNNRIMWVLVIGVGGLALCGSLLRIIGWYCSRPHEHRGAITQPQPPTVRIDRAQPESQQGSIQESDSLSSASRKR